MRVQLAQFFSLAVLLFTVSIAACQSNSRSDAATGISVPAPPMGWNSWDSYGTTVNEQQVKANADWMAAHLKAFGWQYITVDMEWFVSDPRPEGNSKDSHYQIDDFGRFQPAERARKA